MSTLFRKLIDNSDNIILSMFEEWGCPGLYKESEWHDPQTAKQNWADRDLIDDEIIMHFTSFNVGRDFDLSNMDWKVMFNCDLDFIFVPNRFMTTNYFRSIDRKFFGMNSMDYKNHNEEYVVNFIDKSKFKEEYINIIEGKECSFTKKLKEDGRCLRCAELYEYRNLAPVCPEHGVC